MRLQRKTNEEAIRKMKVKLWCISAFIIIIVLIIAIVVGSVNKKSNSIIESNLIDENSISEVQREFYENVYVEIDEVDKDEQTATVIVSMPDLKKAIETGDSYAECQKTVTMTAPVIKEDGEWVLASKESLDELIVEEMNAMFYELIEENGGLNIEFDAEEMY